MCVIHFLESIAQLLVCPFIKPLHALSYSLSYATVISISLFKSATGLQLLPIIIISNDYISV